MALEDLTTLAGESVYQNGEVVEGDDQSDNENTIRNKLNDVITELALGLVAETNKVNTFTQPQNFNQGLLTGLIQSLTTGANILLDPQGGLVYVNSVDAANELATKGYVNLTAGNIPPGGTVNNWLEGNGLWSDPRWYADESSPSSGFTAVNKGNYVLNAGDSIQLPAPSAGLKFIFRPQIGQDLTRDPTNAITLLRNGSENIAGTAMDLTCSVNGEYTIFSNGTDWDFRIARIGRKR